MLNLNQNMLSGNLNNSVHGYQRDLQGNTDVSGTSRSDMSAARTGNAVLNNMNEGDVFSGEIVDIHNHDVSIRLNDNSVVNAFLKQALQMNIGQKIIFQVREKTDNQIFIRPMEDKGVSADLINKSLLGAGLSVNAKNSAIVSELINAGQPIDRQSVIGYIKLANQYGLENIDKLIEMNKHDISISQENIEIYEKYTQSEHQLSEMTQQVDSEMNACVDSLFSGDIASHMPEIEAFSHMLTELSDMYAVTDSRIPDAETVENHVPQEVITEDDEKSVQSDTLKNTGISDEKHITDSLEKAEVIGKSGHETLKDLAKTLSDIAKSVSEEDMDKGQIKNKLAEIKHKLRENLQHHLRLNMNDVEKDSAKLKEQTELLYEKLSKTADIIKNAAPAVKSQGLADAAGELKNNLSFMSELNHMESYIQLPVKMSTNDANGDLYVYNRRKGKKNDNEPLTAFLHLDLDSLGATNINISLKNSDVTIRFTLDNDESEKLILEHLDELGEKLEKKGYKAVLSADSETQPEDTAKNALMPIIGHNTGATSIRRYTFDLRA